MRYHTTDNWALTNKNTADALGDTAFICTTLATSTHTYDELISLFEVQGMMMVGLAPMAASRC